MTPYCANQKSPGGKAYYQAKSGPSIWRKRTQTQTKRCPNGVKLYKHGPHIPIGPPDKTWARTASPGGDYPMGAPNPLQAPFTPNFGRLVPTASPTSVAWVFMKDSSRGWQFAQDKKACKEAQLHSISTIHHMMVCEMTPITAKGNPQRRSVIRSL